MGSEEGAWVNGLFHLWLFTEFFFFLRFADFFSFRKMSRDDIHLLNIASEKQIIQQYSTVHSTTVQYITEHLATTFVQAKWLLNKTQKRYLVMYWTNCLNWSCTTFLKYFIMDQFFYIFVLSGKILLLVFFIILINDVCICFQLCSMCLFVDGLWLSIGLRNSYSNATTWYQHQQQLNSAWADYL